MASPIYKDCDQILFIKNLKDRDGEFVNTATVTYSIVSKHLVDDEIQDLDSGTLDFVSDGRYEKNLSIDVTGDIVIGMFYNIFITVATPENDDLKKRLEVYGEYQT